MSNKTNYKIYPNQEETAQMVLNSINLGNKRIHVVAPTQSGKTGTVISLAHSMENKNFLLTSGMMENHLFNQNSYIAENYADNIKAIKVHQLLKSPNPKSIVENLEIDVIVIDESHYGVGQESRLDKLIYTLSHKCPDLVIIWVGATGYQLINSKAIDDTIQMIVPKEYYGVSDMLNSSKFISNDSFVYLETVDKEVREKAEIDYGAVINDDFKKVLLYFKSFNNGLGIIRTNKKDTAEVIKIALNNSYPYAKVLIATSDTGISDTVKDAQMISRKKRVILIVVQGLKAGVDLGETKSSIRFVIETYKTMAAVTQGLVGRLCGYHENRDCLIVANRKALELQAKYENDYRVINDDFLEELFGLGNTRLAANLNIGSKREYRSDNYYGGKVYKIKNINSVNSEMFGNYNEKYAEKVRGLMVKMVEKSGKYNINWKEDYPDKDVDRINTLQSGKFKKRHQFDAYLKKITKDNFNFSSVFHRFKDTSGKRGKSNYAGGITDKQYAEAIKVGVVYDDTTRTFYLAVRDENKTSTETVTSINNKSIFNK